MTQHPILTRLERGPATMRELAELCGYEADDPRGPSYVSMRLTRLRRAGYVIANQKRPGSHDGGRYVLVSRPRVTTEARTCIDCGAVLGWWNDGDRCCPCERAHARLVDLPWPRVMRLDVEAPPTGTGSKKVTA